MDNTIENFEINAIQEVGKIYWNFDILRSQLQELLRPYENLVYTEENIKDAKQDRAKLNKLKKEIQSKQKECKEACLNPYKEIEPSIKKLIEMVEKQSGLIDSCVKEYEEKAKQEKRIQIKKYYDTKALPLGDLAEKLYPKIYNSKWENATVSQKKYQDEIIIAIGSSISDLNKINEENSPFKKQLIDLYCDTISLEAVLKKNEELLSVLNKTLNISIDKGAYKTELDTKVNIPDDDDGKTIKIYANTNQLNQILDFIKIIGAKYEEL